MKFSIPGTRQQSSGMENSILIERKYFYYCTNEDIHYLFYITLKLSRCGVLSFNLIFATFSWAREEAVAIHKFRQSP